MTKFTATFATTAAALLFAGSAFAQMPAAGEAPYFQNEVRFGAQSDTPRAKVSIRQVASGEMSGVVEATSDVNSPTRAAVRQEARDAIAKGQGPAIGARS